MTDPLPPAATAALALPDDGAYPGMSHDDYAKWDVASHHRLADLERSPAFCRAQMTAARERTPAMIRGEALHALVLEPDTFGKRFVLKDFDARTKDGKVRRDEVEALGLCALDVATWDDVKRASASVLLHPLARSILDACPSREVSVLATIDGRRVKGRPDAYGADVLVDVKSTKDAMPRSFPRFATESRVDRQLALYAHLVAGDGVITDMDCRVIAVMDSAPYEVAVYELDDADVLRAWQEEYALLRRYWSCVESGAWPTGTEEAVPFARAKWDAARLPDEPDEPDIIFSEVT